MAAKPGLGHADDSDRVSPQAQRGADRVVPALEAPQPQRVADHRHWRRPRRVIGGPDETPALGARSEHAKEAARDELSTDDLGRARVRHGKPPADEGFEHRQGARALPHVAIRGIREPREPVEPAVAGDVQAHEPASVDPGHGSQHERVHHAEEAGAGADGQRERQDDRYAEPGLTSQRPRRDAQLFHRSAPRSSGFRKLDMPFPVLSWSHTACHARGTPAAGSRCGSDSFTIC